MTPTVREVLAGVAMVIASPSPPEAGPMYDASRKGLASSLAMLAAQEAEHLAGATIAENADIRSVLAKAGAHDAGGACATAAAATDADLSTPALDASNANLRRLLTDLHTRVETAGDAEMHRTIVALYGRMAAGRRLALGG